MNNFVILTENTADLPKDYLKEHKEIVILPLTFTLNSVEYDGLPENSPSSKEFYDALRAGKSSTTAQASPETLFNLYKSLLSQYDGVLHICFSSGLSGTYQSAMIAIAQLREEAPDARVICVDSLSASLGQGLFVDYIAKLCERGETLEAAAKAAEDITQHVCHYFTVDDLNHLHRGGRVSKTAAVVGSMLGIKPILHVDEEGHLIPIGKVRGRKASLDALVDKMANKLDAELTPYVFISHGDALQDAEYVAESIKKRFGLKAEIINDICPIIGSHSGPGTIALFFFGSDRGE